ncbi:hypothetical protein, partial [Serratia sp. DD3]|uniref:hypothetical protein n=1 Tax=Serratia sp. DD3 TaxID=1410619 RepID=UPI001F3E1A2A
RMSGCKRISSWMISSSGCPQEAHLGRVVVNGFCHGRYFFRMKNIVARSAIVCTRGMNSLGMAQ